ncbi:MAG: helix-turn-helix domain-containing protein [Acidimicrobiales bacterium]
MSEPQPQVTTQTRTPRAIGIEHMVDATIRLLQDRSPEQITVRDIAEAAGHHHRFVQAWFGGKAGLLRAVFDRLLEDVARGIPSPLVARDGFTREVRTAALLMNWLMAAEPGSLDAPRPTPIVDRVIAVYRNEFGLDENLARLMALRLVGGAVSVILFSGPLGITQDDLPALIQLEVDLARLMARAGATVD